MLVLQVVWHHWLAVATATPTPPPLEIAGIPLSSIFSFAQFGLLGIIFLMIITKKYIVPEWSLRDLKESHERELKRLTDQLDSAKLDIRELKQTTADLQSLTSEKMIPALVQANTLSAAYVSELARRTQHRGGGLDGS